MPKVLRCVAVVGILVGLIAAWPVAASVAETRTKYSEIPYLPALRPQVEFWKKVFAVYSRREVVIHDTERLDRVYSVIDFRPLAEAGVSDAEFEVDKRAEVDEERERIRALLVGLHQVGDEATTLTPEERRIAAMFDDDPNPNKFLDAADPDRIRSQTGLRERFAAGVEISRRYLPEMESIFRREGVPVEITRLPLVESCFNVNAYSKVGAAGIWQFMPATGRLYMRVDDEVDERRDPITSTAAAARHLRRDYDVLGSWPLAITAYNHGRGGIERAVETVGTNDLQEIVKRYRGPGFKFASRNFYAEFLAALEVEQNFQEYFGPLSPHRPLHADAVVIPGDVRLEVLASLLDMSPGELADLNPALSAAVVSGHRPVPRGYTLRVPRGANAGFETRYAALSDRHKQSAPTRAAVSKAKATRAKSKAGVRVVNQRVKPGQTRAAVSKAKATQAKSAVIHRVKPGQTLSAIAKRYGTSVEAIRKRNGLRPGSSVQAGQNLVIPAG